jgi:hypothetical protein
MKYHVTGRYEWYESRLYHCVADLDCVVTADSAETAIERAIDALDGEPDYDQKEGDTDFESDDQTKVKAIELPDGHDNDYDDPALDAKRNLELMRRHSAPLFAEYR